MVQATVTQTLYVDPLKGDDRGSGAQASPYRTLARALRRATAGTLIRLVPGRYGTVNGETFPLEVGPGVQVLGELANRGQRVIIDGGGDFLSPTFARQNTTFRMGNGATIQGVLISNRNSRGTGIWIEDGTGAIAHCTFTNCGREGVLATGSANPSITDSTFQQNAASGISLTRNTKGEIRRNVFQQTGYGIAISDTAAPLLTENRVLNNRAGIVISGSARPVLRNNLVESNQADGLVVMNSAVPDLGHSQDPAGNIFRGNGGSDVRNASVTPLLSVGNDLSPTRVNVNISGSSQGVVFQASEVNDQIRTVIPRPVPAPPTEPPVVPPPPPPSPVEQPTTGNLPDIVGHWAEPFIRALVERNLIGGYPDGTFKPETSLNRGQYAALIARVFNLPDRRTSSSFVDVPANFWAAEAIAKAEAMGFIAGFPDGTFRPTLPLSRVQAVVSLVSGLELSGGRSEALSVYRDRAEIPTYAAVAVATATQKRLVVNYPEADRFEPLIDITRAEMAVMIYQALVVSGQARAIGSPYLVMPPPATVAFADIRNHWGEAFMRGLASQSLISGFEDGSFRPDSPVTRAQYAAILVNTFNPLAERPAVDFQDVPPNHWAANAIQRAYQGRLLSGNADGTFRPDQNILRVEVLLSLVNGLELPLGDPALTERYRDRDAIPAMARPAVASATAHGLVVNYPNVAQLNPAQAATRAEVSAMVYQALVYWGRSPAIASPYIVSVTGDRDDQSNGTPPAPEVAPLVVLDPGHGGTDTGAIGLNYLLEKNVNLAIALEAARILKEFQFRVLLTRNDDRALSLADRVAIAEQAQADLFISIHANSAGSDRPTVNGAETYHYPGSVAGAELAQAIQTSIVRATEVNDRGVKSANFFVLRQTTMPAVLVETGFVTGSQDAPRLANPTFQTAVARAIAVGVFQHLEDPVG